MVLRAILLSLGPFFLVIPIIVYIICIIKFKGEKLPDGYASFERRALAFVIDSCIYLILDFVVKTGYSKLSFTIPLPPGLIIWSLTILNIVILPTITGWSIGKGITSIKIVKKGNKKAEFIDIVYRELVKNWFSVGIVFFGCLWMFIGKEKLTWHDSVADTRVVNMNRKDNKVTETEVENHVTN